MFKASDLCSTASWVDHVEKILTVKMCCCYGVHYRDCYYSLRAKDYAVFRMLGPMAV